MYIGLIKTFDNQIARELDTFGEALDFVNRIAEGRTDLEEILILDDEGEMLDDQCPDFRACKVVASLRTIR